MNVSLETDRLTLPKGERGHAGAAGLFEIIYGIDAQMQGVPHSVGTGVSEEKALIDQSKHLVFGLNFCQLAIQLTNLVEVQRKPRVTRVPNVPEWLLGVSNLRGDIISIVDLRQLLKMASYRHQRTESIIVVRSNQRELVAGLVVDQLLGFRNLRGLRPAGSSTLPQLAKLPYTSRVVKNDKQQVAVLDTEKLLGSAEFCQFWL